MTIIVKPAGRGRWAAMQLSYSGSRLAPFTVRIGERFFMGGITWRVCAVRP